MCLSYGFYWGLGETVSSQSGMLFLTHAMRNMAISELAVGSSKGLIYSKFARLEGETTIYEGEAPVKGKSRKLATVTPPTHTTHSRHTGFAHRPLTGQNIPAPR